MTGGNIYNPHDGPAPHQQAKPQVQPYHGGAFTDSATGHLDQSPIPPPPDVPPASQQGRGNISVDTSSLNKFADNLDGLADMLGTARQRLEGITQFAAGAFKEAEDLKAQVIGAPSGSGSGSGSSKSSSSAGSGSNSAPSSGGSAPTPDSSTDTVDGEGGLRGNYHRALHDLRTALMETAENVRTLANKYTTIEDINQKAGAELHQLINTAEHDLQSLQQDQL